MNIEESITIPCGAVVEPPGSSETLAGCWPSNLQSLSKKMAASSPPVTSAILFKASRKNQGAIVTKKLITITFSGFTFYRTQTIKLKVY